MIYRHIIRPTLFAMDPEFVHDCFLRAGRLLGSNALTRGALRLNYHYKHPALLQKIQGITFGNPVGLAAGYDKDCVLMKVVPTIGFGFEEVGSITAEPYAGNPRPRLVRLPKDEGIIVYYGLKNKGANALRQRFVRPDGTRIRSAIPIGISVAKSNKLLPTTKEKIEDWLRGIRLVKDWSDYLTFNLSCPNTHDFQSFCEPGLLAELLSAIERAKIRFRTPVFLKLSADISTQELDEIIQICDRHRFIKGFVLSNLTKDRSKLKLKSAKTEYEPYVGGISGKVVRPLALKLVRHAYKKVGDHYTIIGCGGIFTPEDAYEYIKSGASLLQLITGLVYGGPRTIRRINKGLVKLLKKDGYAHISEAVGADVKASR